MSTPTPYTPSHPDLFLVHRAEGEFNSSLRAVKAFTTGETITRLEGLTVGPKAYSSVQCGRDDDGNQPVHIELCSDLSYVNHSCRPNVAFDMSSSNKAEWHARALRDIKSGDTLCFYYPSTEWEMAQSFQCGCGESNCQGVISGASGISLDKLKEGGAGYISPWILELVNERDRK